MKIQDNRHQWDSWNQVEKFRDQKIYPPGSLTGANNTNLENADISMSVAEESTRKATGSDKYMVVLQLLVTPC